MLGFLSVGFLVPRVPRQTRLVPALVYQFEVLQRYLARGRPSLPVRGQGGEGICCALWCVQTAASKYEEATVSAGVAQAGLLAPAAEHNWI